MTQSTVLPIDGGGEPNELRSNLLPQRNPGLIQRVARAIIHADPKMGPQPSQQASTLSGAYGISDKQSIFESYFDTQNDRESCYSDAEEMDSMSEEASVALDIIADNSVSSEDGTMQSFEVHSPDPEVLSVLEEVCRRTRLHHNIYSIARNAVKYGDVFLEIVVNDENEVVDVRQLPPKTMHRNEDASGNLMLGQPQYSEKGACLNRRGECAFDQRNPDNQAMVAAFYPWQVIHGRYNHDGFSKYGRSFLRVSRIIWKKLHAEEEALIMGRLVRAMMKLAFYIDTTGQSKAQKMATLKEFQDSILSKTTGDGKREKPFSVMTDFFLAVEHVRFGGQTVESKTRIEPIDPKNEGLVQIDDIKHFHRKLLATLRVPPAYYGFEEQVNSRSTVSMQDVNFIRFLRRLQQFLGHCLRQVFDVSLVIKGFDPFDVEYDIHWPPLSTADDAAAADAFYKEAQGWALLLGTNSLNQTPVVDREWIQRHGLQLTDEQVVELNKRLDKLEQEELDKSQEQADDEHNKQLELLRERLKGASRAVDNRNPGAAVSATPGPNPDRPQQGTNASQVHDHLQRADRGRTANGSDTSVRQEVHALADTIESRLANLLDPEFDRIEEESHAAMVLAVSSNGHKNGHKHAG